MPLGALVAPVVKQTAKRLAITPSSLSEVLRRARPRLRGFPWAAPTWPSTLERPTPPKRLGVDYETDWARRYPVRLARAMLTEAVGRPLVRAIADPSVTGLDRIKDLEEPLIFAANHASHVDTPLMVSVLPDRWRHRLVVAAASDYFFDKRWKAAFFAMSLNAVPIERNRVHRASAGRLVELLKADWSLLIYPEGGRSPDGWGQNHKAGAAWLAVRTGLTVVPVHIEGTGAILSRGSSRIHPGTARVNFGRPIRTEIGSDPRALAVRLERELALLADEQSTDWWTSLRRAAAGATPSLTGPQVPAWRRSWALDSKAHAKPDGHQRWPKR